MASVVDICNLALAHLGDDARITSISPPDGSQQAAHCQRFYPIARDGLLEMHNWRFATKRASLALLDTDELPVEWGFAYGYPACIKIVSVHFPDEVASAPTGAIFDATEFISVPKAQAFTVETLSDGTQVIFTNVENASARFIANVTDTTKFSPLFIIGLSHLLAAYLAGPIIKGEAGMKIARSHLEWFERLAGPRAQASDARVGKDDSYMNFTPSSLAARR